VEANGRQPYLSLTLIVELTVCFTMPERKRSPRSLGVCYYPEHWDESRWPEDLRRMRSLGIKFVRVAEFAWSRLESEPEKFDFR
jgi:beta-galactosidase GanA